MVKFPQIPSPCFVLEEEKLIRNLKVFKHIQNETGIRVLVALKGFAFYHSFPLVKEYLAGATASSLNEATLIYQEMGRKAHVCAPAYLDNEIDELLKISSHITFNSLNQLERFRGKLKKEHEVAIRVNPGYSPVKTEIYNPCVKGTRLGVRSLDKLPEGVTGLHVHALCENSSYEFEEVLTSFIKNFEHLLDEVQWINFGGGHLATRSDYDVQHLIGVLNQFKKRFKGEIFIEPGSAIGWQTGFLKSTVQDVINDEGVKTAILDTSFSNHMPDCLEMPYKPAVRFSAENGYAYRLGGCTCLAGDFMEDFRFDKPLEIGDEVIFDDMIHYTMVKTTTFNGVNLPSIGTIKADGSFKLHKQFGYNEYKSRL